MSSGVTEEVFIGPLLPGGRERRVMQRFHCVGFAEAFAADPGILFRGEIRDISQTGCYVSTRARVILRLFMQLDVSLILKNRTYSLGARIMNVRPGRGVGLEFIFRDAKEKEAFQQLFYDATH